MENLLKTRIFWVTAASATIALFVILAFSGGQKYKGETDILVLAKSDKTSRNLRQIIGSVTEVPRSLMFYEKLLEKNPDIEDIASGMPDYNRKKAWNEIIKIRQAKKSGVVKISVFSESQLQAAIISQKIAEDIAVVMGRYYDPKTDLDIRIIDGPIVSQKNGSKNFGFFIISLVGGIIFGLIVSTWFSLNRKSFLSLPRPKISFPPFTAGKSKKGSFVEAEVAENIFAMPAASKKAEVPAAKKSLAPENLPVGSEFVLSALRRTEKAEKKKEEAAEPKTHEATEEEIKNRLNKLLGGNIKN